MALVGKVRDVGVDQASRRHVLVHACMQADTDDKAAATQRAGSSSSSSSSSGGGMIDTQSPRGGRDVAAALGNGAGSQLTHPMSTLLSGVCARPTLFPPLHAVLVPVWPRHA
jgi:hypothetical protein